MSKINFSLEIKRKFSQAEWPWVLMALREDDGVWNALENTDLGIQALEGLPPDFRAWSPAALAFLALDVPVSLDAMKVSPLQPLDENLFHQASQVYEEWIKNQRAPKNLSDAGLLALTFREQFRLSGSWRDGQGLGEIEPNSSKTSLSCLYSIIPEPLGLLRALAQAKNPELARLAVHILLSNPSSPETQLKALNELAFQLDPSIILIILKSLSASRPHLALLLARQVIDRSPSVWSAGMEEGNDPEGVFQLEQLIKSLRMAQVHQIAGQAEMAVPVLSDSLRMMRKMRAHLSAQLAHSVAQTKDVTTESWGDTARIASVEAWKQAVLLTPDEPGYAAGYARALHQSGRYLEAAEYLKKYIEEEKRPLNPELVLIYTLALAGVGEEEKAIQFGLKAYEMLHKGQFLSEPDLVLLSRYLAKMNHPQEALDTVQMGLAAYPASRELLALSAKIWFLLGRHEEAITAAYASQAAEQNEFSIGDLKDPGERDEDNDSHSPEDPELSSSEIQRLLVESLESVNSWDAAYQERLKLLEGQKEPSEDDLWALGNCAAEAKKYDKVIQICQQLLQNAPDRLSYHQRLAEAAEALGDYPTAIEHFDRSIQLAPDQSALWKGLYRTQKTAGQVTAAYETLRAASQALPDDSDLQLQLGELYLSQGAPTLALPCLRRAYDSSINGGETEIIAIRLGETLLQIGRQDEARQVLEPIYESLNAAIQPARQSVGELNPGAKIGPELAYIYARTLLELKEPEKAVPILTYVVRERPSDPRPCLDLSKGLMMLSDQVSGSRRALPFLEQVLGVSADVTPNPYEGRLETDPLLRAEARALLAEAYTAAGEWEKGMEAYRKALEEPANREATKQTRLSLGLGLTALRLELPEMAVAALQEAAHAEPLNGQIQRSLSEAYLSNGLTQDAFLAAQTALELAPMDLDVLIWFVEQGLRIAALPGASSTPIQSEIIRAIRSALTQAPDRADLLIKLGGLLLQTGKRDEALEAFRKLAALDTILQKVEVDDLYRSALAVLDAGEARLAVALLRKAISQSEGVENSPEKRKDHVSLADLYDALVRAFEKLGDMDGALEAIDQALILEKTRLAFHITRFELLYKMGRYEDARTGLDFAIQRWPENAGLRGRMARVLRALGELPAALQQVELAIASLDEETEQHLERELFQLAAKLAFATLRPRRAFAYLQKAIPESDPDFDLFENAILRAELALEAGEEAAAAHAIATFEAQAVETPRVLAACGRLACRRGERDIADRKCRSAVREWTKQQTHQPGQTPATTVDEFIAELTSIGMAALENRQWEAALSIFKQMVVMFPEEPLAHFKLAEAMLVCAEAQALCQEIEVVEHAPGADSLLEPARNQFEERLNAAAVRAGCAEILKPDGVMEDWDVEIKRSIGLCSRRGRAVFLPLIENAVALEYLLQTVIPDTEDLISLIMAYRRCGEKNRAVKSVQVGWQPVFEGKDYRSDPRVMVQLALAETDPQKAIEILNELIDHPGDQGNGWPEPAMIKFLLAKLYYQTQDFPTALVTIQAALLDWPEEPRWLAFAAKIHSSQPAANRLQQLADAIGFYEKAAALEPNHSIHQLELGQIYLESGQIRQAIQALEQVTRLDPGNAAGWLMLAKAQYSVGDMDQAAISSERAIEYTEDPIDALLLRAEIALQTCNYRGALSRAQTVLRSKPEHSQALYILAKALDGLNRPAEALSALDLALPHFENPIPIQLERLRLIKRSQSLEAGLKALQELVAQNPKQASFLALLAEWLQEAGKQDAAVQAARLALQEGLEGLTLKQRADLHTMIGLHMRRSGQLDQAIHHLSEAIIQSSDHLDAYLELGRVYQDRREYQQALKVYQKAINLAGDDYRPYYQAGLVLKDNKDYMAAEAMLRRATQLAPNEVSVHRLLGAVVALNLVHSHRLIPGEARGD